MTRRQPDGADAGADARSPARAASQTLTRGLDLIEAVARRQLGFTELARQLGLSESTAHRLAGALVARGYLTAHRGEGYRLGARLMQLASSAQSQIDLVQIARPHLDALAQANDGTVRLGVLERDRVVYLDVVRGRSEVAVASRPGESQPLTRTSAGLALLLDEPESIWRARALTCADIGRIDDAGWLARMRDFTKAGVVTTLDEDGEEICGVAAPVRDAAGRIVAAIGVAGPATHITRPYVAALAGIVRAAGISMSQDLGWAAAEPGL